jgi:hypothetical protein
MINLEESGGEESRSITVLQFLMPFGMQNVSFRIPSSHIHMRTLPEAKCTVEPLFHTLERTEQK